MNYYELLYIIPAKYTDAEEKQIKEKINKFLEDKGAKIAFESTLGKQKLNYKIKGFTHGTYNVVEFSNDPQNLKEINTELNLMHEVLRHLIVSKKELTAEEREKEQKLKEQMMQEIPETQLLPEEKPVVKEQPKEEIKEVEVKEPAVIEEKTEEEKPEEIKETASVEAMEDKVKKEEPKEEIKEEPKKDDDKKPAAASKVKIKEKKEKINLEDLDKKLDEILENEMI